MTIPDSCVLVEFNAFYNCFSLEGIKLSDNMRLIDESTFEGCRSLKIVDLPARLVKIGRRAFKGCSSLISIILPVGTLSIGFDAFSGCSLLGRIAIPKELTEFEDDEVFGGCDNLNSISYGGSREEWERLMRGKTLTLQKSDCSVLTPTVSFMNLK